MATKHKVRKRRRETPFRSSDRQTLGERIRWLRAHAKPYMTLRQLSILSGIKESNLSWIENNDIKHINIELDTLRKIAHALDVKIFINLKRKTSPLSEECLPLENNQPPLPKLKRKWTERGHRLAQQHGSYPWKNYRKRKKRPAKQLTNEAQ